MISCWLGAIVLCLAAPPSDPKWAVPAWDAVIDRALDRWQVPGAAVIVVTRDRVLYLGGRGVRAAGKPERMTPDTIFPIASCSKAFTTTLLAMLVDDKKVDWDDPVRKHLKEFHLADPLADGDVRLRDLVSHRTGVAGHDLLWYRAAWDTDEMIRRVGILPLSQPFRTKMQYQSIMFTAAGKFAGNASGKPWAELVEDRIFKPLEMKSAGVTSTKAHKNADLALPHRIGKKGPEAMPSYPMPDPNPAGSIHLSARDLAPWLQLHLNEGTHGEARLVSEKSLKETRAPQIVISMDEETRAIHPFTEQMCYGMAWVIQDYRGELLVSHAGLSEGFRAHFTLLPRRGLAIGVLANLDRTRFNLALSNEIVDTMLKAPAHDWHDLYRKQADAEEFAAKVRATQIERNRKRGTKPTLPLEAYVGTFEEPAYGTAKISLKDDHLFLHWSSFNCQLEHFENDTFRVLDEMLGDTPLRFHLKNGNLEAMTAMDVKFARQLEK